MCHTLSNSLMQPGVASTTRWDSFSCHEVDRVLEWFWDALGGIPSTDCSGGPFSWLNEAERGTSPMVHTGTVVSLFLPWQDLGSESIALRRRIERHEGHEGKQYGIR
jgi:hypothetical protein